MRRSHDASANLSNERSRNVPSSRSASQVSADGSSQTMDPLSIQDSFATQGSDRVLSEQRDEKFIGRRYSSGGLDMSQSGTRHTRSKNILGGRLFSSSVQLFSPRIFLGLSKPIAGLTSDGTSDTSRSDIGVNTYSSSSSKNYLSCRGLSSPKIDSLFSSGRKKGRNKLLPNPSVPCSISPGKRDLLSRLPGLLKRKFVTCGSCRFLLLILDVKIINPSVPFILNVIQKASVGNDGVADLIVIGLVDVPSQDRKRWKDVCEESLGGLFPLKGAGAQFHLILPSAKCAFKNPCGQLLLPFISSQWHGGVHSVEISEAIVPSASRDEGPPCGGRTSTVNVEGRMGDKPQNCDPSPEAGIRLSVLALQRQLFCSVVERQCMNTAVTVLIVYRLQFNGSPGGSIWEYPIIIFMGTLPSFRYFAPNTIYSVDYKLPNLSVTVTFPQSRYSSESVEYIKMSSADDNDRSSANKSCCTPTCEFCKLEQFEMDRTSLVFCTEKETGRGAFGTGLLHVSATNSVTLERSITHLRHLYETSPTACQADVSPSIELFPPLVDLPPIRPFESYTVTFTIRNTHSTLPACYSLLCLNAGSRSSRSTLIPLTRCSFWHRSTSNPMLSRECMQQEICHSAVHNGARAEGASNGPVASSAMSDNSTRGIVLERWLLAHPSEGCLLSGQKQVVKLILRIMEGVTAPILITSLVVVVRLNDSAKDYFFSLSTSVLPSFYCLSIPQLFTFGKHNILASGEAAHDHSHAKDLIVKEHDQLECLPLPKELWWLFRHFASRCFGDTNEACTEAFRLSDFLSVHNDISFTSEYLRYQWNWLSASNDADLEAEVEFVKMCVESGIAIPDTVSLKSTLIVMERWCLSSPWPLLPREFLANIDGDETHSLCRAVLLSLPTLQRNVLICVLSMFRELWLKEYSCLIEGNNEDDISNVQNALLEWLCRWVTKDSPHSVAREILHHFLYSGPSLLFS